MALSLDTTPAKHVTVIKNGDARHQGTKFIVNRKRYRTFESLLADITSHISPSFGAVRQLYTPTSGRKIESIEELDSGGTYIASGFERFKKLDYRSENRIDKGFVSQKYIPSLKPGYLADAPPPRQLPRRNKLYARRSAQFYKVLLPIQFTVYKNGQPLEKAHRFLVQSKELRNYDLILETISRKLMLNDGAVRRLYTVDGIRILTVAELTDGGVYVATGSRKFVHAAYGETLHIVRPPKLPPIQARTADEVRENRTESDPVPEINEKASSERNYTTKKRDPESRKPEEVDVKTPAKKAEEIKAKPPAARKIEAKSPSAVQANRINANSPTVPPKTEEKKITTPVSKRPHNNNPNSDDESILQQHNGPNNGYDAVNGPNINIKGNYLMSKQNEISSTERADSVKEVAGLIEDKPIGLQAAVEVGEYLE